MGASYQGPGVALERYEAPTRKAMVSIRLSDDDTEEFRSSYESGDSLQYGRTMRGSSTVPDDLLSRTDELAGWVERSQTHLATLKPK